MWQQQPYSSVFDVPLTDWLAIGTLHRAVRLGALIAAAAAVYFGVLLVVGVRPRDLRAQPV